MADKPIPFSAPMVRATLDDLKEQTRRILKPQPQCFQDPPGFSWGKYSGLWPDDWFGYGNEIDGALPYAPGDRLWVREAWRTEARFDHLPPRDVPHDALVSYEADYDQEPNDGCRGRYRHARFMPRWASRITLEVTDVRVQRLGEISHDDAVAEGVGIYPHSMSAQKRFREIWEGIHGPGAWEANPWVVAVSFRPSPVSGEVG